jgi:hypothetical protein
MLRRVKNEARLIPLIIRPYDTSRISQSSITEPIPFTGDYEHAVTRFIAADVVKEMASKILAGLLKAGTGL